MSNLTNVELGNEVGWLLIQNCDHDLCFLLAKFCAIVAKVLLRPTRPTKRLGTLENGTIELDSIQWLQCHTLGQWVNSSFLFGDDAVVLESFESLLSSHSSKVLVHIEHWFPSLHRFSNHTRYFWWYSSGRRACISLLAINCLGLMHRSNDGQYMFPLPLSTMYSKYLAKHCHRENGQGDKHSTSPANLLEHKKSIDNTGDGTFYMLAFPPNIFHTPRGWQLPVGTLLRFRCVFSIMILACQPIHTTEAVVSVWYCPTESGLQLSIVRWRKCTPCFWCGIRYSSIYSDAPIIGKLYSHPTQLTTLQLHMCTVMILTMCQFRTNA